MAFDGAQARPFGCARGRLVMIIAVLVLSAAIVDAQSDAVPTFTKDIAPIVWARCAGCHRPGAVGPFNLITYDDLTRRAALIADVTARRIMPPWKPVAGHGDFADSRRLTDDELRRLQRWLADGA